MNELDCKSVSLEVARNRRNLCQTQAMAEGYLIFKSHIPDRPELEELGELIVGMAKEEWGAQTTVILTSEAILVTNPKARRSAKFSLENNRITKEQSYEVNPFFHKKPEPDGAA